jgi:hypothetical protein
MSGEAPRLVGAFIAANSETRMTVGDVTIDVDLATFASGLKWRLEFVDRARVLFSAENAGKGLPPFANTNGHWAEKHLIAEETIPRGGRSVAKRGSVVIIQFDEPTTSIQITPFAKSLLGTRHGPLLVFLTPLQLERWRAEQLRQARER